MAIHETDFLILQEIITELKSARLKFPSSEGSLAALTEEVGELAKALLSESRTRVRDEAVQVAVMAIRVALEGDPSLDGYRNEQGLD